jgi:hypothetical protein
MYCFLRKKNGIENDIVTKNNEIGTRPSASRDHAFERASPLNPLAPGRASNFLGRKCIKNVTKRIAIQKKESATLNQPAAAVNVKKLKSRSRDSKANVNPVALFFHVKSLDCISSELRKFKGYPKIRQMPSRITSRDRGPTTGSLRRISWQFLIRIMNPNKQVMIEAATRTTSFPVST